MHYFSIFFYSSRSSLITRILLAFLVNQSANSGERANDSKAAFVDSVSSSSASSALKNLPRELLARPTGGIRFLSFPLELLVVVENGGGDFFLPPLLLLFVVFLPLEDPPPGVGCGVAVSALLVAATIYAKRPAVVKQIVSPHQESSGGREDGAHHL